MRFALFNWHREFAPRRDRLLVPHFRTVWRAAPFLLERQKDRSLKGLTKEATWVVVWAAALFGSMHVLDRRFLASGPRNRRLRQRLLSGQRRLLTGDPTHVLLYVLHRVFIEAGGVRPTTTEERIGELLKTTGVATRVAGRDFERPLHREAELRELKAEGYLRGKRGPTLAYLRARRRQLLKSGVIGSRSFHHGRPAIEKRIRRQIRAFEVRNKVTYDVPAARWDVFLAQTLDLPIPPYSLAKGTP